jgi:hypothetical protein
VGTQIHFQSPAFCLLAEVNKANASISDNDQLRASACRFTISHPQLSKKMPPRYHKANKLVLLTTKGNQPHHRGGAEVCSGSIPIQEQWQDSTLQRITMSASHLSTMRRSCSCQAMLGTKSTPFSGHWLITHGPGRCLERDCGHREGRRHSWRASICSGKHYASNARGVGISSRRYPPCRSWKPSHTHQVKVAMVTSTVQRQRQSNVIVVLTCQAPSGSA